MRESVGERERAWARECGRKSGRERACERERERESVGERVGAGSPVYCSGEHQVLYSCACPHFDKRNESTSIDPILYINPINIEHINPLKHSCVSFVKAVFKGFEVFSRWITWSPVRTPFP